MRGWLGLLTREEVGDGEDAERPPDGAQLDLLDQIVHALHPLRHLGLPCAPGRGPGGGGGSGGIDPGNGSPRGGLRRRGRRRRRRRPSGRGW